MSACKESGYWRYLALSQKECYQRNLLRSSLIVYGLAIALVMVWSLWPEGKSVSLSIGFDIGDNVSFGHKSPSSNPVPQVSGSESDSSGPMLALIPEGITTSGYLPGMRVVRDPIPVRIPLELESQSEHLDNLEPVGTIGDEWIFSVQKGDSVPVDLGYYEQEFGSDEPYMPQARGVSYGHGSGDGAATRGIVRLAPLIWPNRIDKSVSGIVVLEVTIPQSRLRPKSYKVLRDDAGFAAAVIEMLDRSKVEPPLFDGERMEITVRWAFHVCWDCEMIFHSSQGLFVGIR